MHATRIASAFEYLRHWNGIFAAAIAGSDATLGGLIEQSCVDSSGPRYHVKRIPLLQSFKVFGEKVQMSRLKV